MRPRLTLAATLAIFTLSGAAGLIYEVVWARQLVLVFGNTTQAVSTILSGFFLGMAIGSGLGGRLADRIPRPLRLYGLLELALVVVVLVTPASFRLLHEVYRGAYGSLEGSPVLLALIRFGLAVLALAPATILMGATLPTLTRHLSHGATGLSQAFGRLYAANTIGAILGTIAAGFVLIELVGLTGTLVLGAACSSTAGLAALALDRFTRSADDPPAAFASTQRREAAPHARVRLALAVAFVSGLTSLGYQTLWTRLLAEGTGNSTYVFTTILAVFLVGLALGAVVFSVMRPRIHDPVNLIAHGQVLVAAFVLVGLLTAFSRHLTGVLDLQTNFSHLFSEYLGPVVLVVLPATIIMGLTFPATSALVADSDGNVAGNAGLLLAANTIGAIFGTFVVPFLLIPLVGSMAATALLAIASAGTGVGLAWRGGMAGAMHRAVVIGTGGAITVGVVALLASSSFADPNIGRITSSGGQVFASAEDEIASVQAGTLGGRPQLWVTGTSMTLLTVDVKLMPILPLITRPSSMTELTIGFGMGSAYRAALIAGLRADAVELVPSVPGMLHWFYPDAGAVLSNPRGRVIIADGRNYVELTQQRYDIIVVDPPPPIESSGVSVISSLEFYQAAKARLTDHGVMMEWVPFTGTIDGLRDQVRTFRTVFPHVMVVRGPGGFGFFMLGATEPVAFDPATVNEVLARPGIAADLSSAYDSPAHDAAGWAALIPRLVLLSGDQVASFARSGPLITDDRPRPEYFLLRTLFGRPKQPLRLDLIRG